MNRPVVFLGYQAAGDIRGVGGIESFSRRAAGLLATVGRRVAFVSYGGPSAAEGECDGLPIVDHPEFSTALHGLARRPPSVVLVNYVERVARARLTAFRRSHRQHIYCRVLALRPGGIVQRALSAADGMLCTYDSAIALSPRLLDDARRIARRAFLVPPLVNPPHAPPVEPPSHDTIRVLYLGRLSVDKGLDRLVKIAGALAGRPGCELRICGYTWDRGSAEAPLAALQTIAGRADNVRLEPITRSPIWSRQLEADVAAHLAYATVLLLPIRSLARSIDIPVLAVEALASGTAVVATTVGDLAWALGDAGRVFAQSDYVDRTLDLLIENREQLLALGARATARARALHETARRSLLAATAGPDG